MREVRLRERSRRIVHRASDHSFRYQDLRGLKDSPQLGHSQAELVEYFTRVRGGDETRSNGELLSRFFANEPDSDFSQLAQNDLAWALYPSTRVHRSITVDGTGLHADAADANARTYRDGRLHLDWR